MPETRSEQIARSRSGPVRSLRRHARTAEWTGKAAATPDRRHIAVVLEHLQSHYSIPFLEAMNEIAAALGTSAQRLAQRVYEETGCTVANHVRRMRVLAASYLIQSTDWPLSRIAGVVGCDSAECLQRDFGCILRRSPSYYRQSEFSAPETPGRVASEPQRALPIASAKGKRQ